MTPEEAGVCLHLLAGHWPQPQLTEEETAAWVRTLLPLEAKLAMGVLDMMALTAVRFRPNDGQFAAEYRKSYTRHLEEVESRRRRHELPEGAVTPERRRQIVAEIKSKYLSA